MSLGGRGPGIVNLAFGVAYLLIARIAVHATWAFDEAIRRSGQPAALEALPASLFEFARAALIGVGYLPLFVGSSLIFLGVSMSCVNGWLLANDEGRRDPLSVFGALIAAGGFAFVMYGVSGPP